MCLWPPFKCAARAVCARAIGVPGNIEDCAVQRSISLTSVRACLVISGSTLRRCQCNACTDPLAYSDQKPVAGQQCFSTLKVRVAQNKLIAQNEFHNFYTDARSLRFTNIDVRIIIDVYEGEVEAMTSLKSDLVVQLDGNYNRSKDLLQVVSNIRGKTVIIVTTSQFMPFARFFLSIRGSAQSKYTVYLDQSVLQINLFVFFSVFFSCFFLFFAILAFASEVRLQLARIEQRQQAEVQLMQLSQRPMAAMQVVLCGKGRDASRRNDDGSFASDLDDSTNINELNLLAKSSVVDTATTVPVSKGSSARHDPVLSAMQSGLPPIRGPNEGTEGGGGEVNSESCSWCSSSFTVPWHRCDACDVSVCGSCHAAYGSIDYSAPPRKLSRTFWESKHAGVPSDTEGSATAAAAYNSDSDDTADSYLEVEGALPTAADSRDIDCDAFGSSGDRDGTSPAGQEQSNGSLPKHPGSPCSKFERHVWLSVLTDSPAEVALKAQKALKSKAASEARKARVRARGDDPWSLLEVPYLEHPTPVASQFMRQGKGTAGTGVHTYLIEQPNGT